MILYIDDPKDSFRKLLELISEFGRVLTHSSVLAWRSLGTGESVGCRLWGRTESDTTEVT